jgi:tRNA pseudouridine38-40 synthase
MVRAIVGTLLWVGRGKIGVAEFGAVVRSQDRAKAGPSAPARGLCLTKVSYDGRTKVERNESEELE